MFVLQFSHNGENLSVSCSKLWLFISTICWQLPNLLFYHFDTRFFLQKLDFLCGGATTTGQIQLSYEQMNNKLKEFYIRKMSFDDIVNWITVIF